MSPSLNRYDTLSIDDFGCALSGASHLKGLARDLGRDAAIIKILGHAPAQRSQLIKRQCH